MVFPVVLCGGVGSRLWPLSRDTHPKPFITLTDGESLLQKAFLRGAEQAHVSEIVTVTNRDLFFKLKTSTVKSTKATSALLIFLSPLVEIQQLPLLRQLCIYRRRMAIRR